MIVGIVAATAAGWMLLNSHHAAGRDAEAIDLARAALRKKQFSDAESAALLVGRSSPLFVRSRVLAGDAAMRAGENQRAMRHFEEAAIDESDEAVTARFSIAELLRDAGRLSESASALETVLKLQPSHAAAHERLAFLLGVAGRRWEAEPHFVAMANSGAGTIDSMALLGDLERPVEQKEFLEHCRSLAPDDPFIQLGLAAEQVNAGHSVAARQSLEQFKSKHPLVCAAQAMLGELLVERDEDFLPWNATLPAGCQEYVDIQFVRGLWLRRHGEERQAVRCFWEAIRREPTHRRAHYQIGQTLAALGDPAARDFGDRAADLFELTQKLDGVLKSRGADEVSLRRVIDLLEAQGRYWEAHAWLVIAANQFPSASWPHEQLAAIRQDAAGAKTRVVPEQNLAIRYDFSSWPEFEAPAISPHRSPSRPSPDVAKIDFETAKNVGVDFQYFNADDRETTGLRPFEQSGGGVAAIDYDCDQLPDLFFGQGAEWPTGAADAIPSASRIDCLYRNQGGRFRDVTRCSDLSEPNYSQGCSTGDFNNDGFPDLYVANIGVNTLFENAGDGTFLDVTRESGIDGAVWSSSCVIVDLNADGQPDLFDVTYLTGEGVYSKICQDHTCSPKVFQGLPDRAWISRGDGSFAKRIIDATDKGSKGLGIVAFHLEGESRPSLFISNDQVANHLLKSQVDGTPEDLQFEDVGFLSGLAFNQDGLPMACMGIAADDIDGNGLTDFYVSNFKDESNTLYLQHSSGLFTDSTNAAGLRASSLPYVGWGTQFLDADLDGEMDLVVANGDVDDYRPEGGEFGMRPQFLRKMSGVEYEELFSGQAGSFFGEKHVGRGLAKVDWNGDGRMDFVVSNLNEPASVVENRTQGIGRFLNVRVHALHGARDAIGTRVELTAAGRTWIKQLTAGDGYMASNERVLQFGLGEVNAVDEVRITWPTGGAATFRTLPTDRTLEYVEDQAMGTLWDRGAGKSVSVN